MAKQMTQEQKLGQSFYYKRGSVGVLMIHGFTSTPYVFRELGEALAKEGYTVSAPLLAGHGTSPEDLELTTWKDWCHSAIESYNEMTKDCDQIVLIGGSLGANVACYVAARKKVAGLVIIGIPRWVYKHALWVLLSPITMRLGIRFFIKPMSKEYSDDALFGGPTHSYLKIPIRSIREALYLVTNVTERCLRRITAPTLVIQSTHDGLVKPESGKFVFEHLRSKNKHLIWINEPHHQLHNGSYETLVYNLITEYMLGWVMGEDQVIVNTKVKENHGSRLA